MTTISRAGGATLCALALAGAVPWAEAQTYPERPVRLIVPIGAGGASDAIARTVGQRLTDSLGQAVVIDNRPGASKFRSGINVTHVPYKGSGPAMIDLIGGQVQALFVNIIAGVPHMKAGRMKALGVTGAKRSAMSPEIPTISESGVPGFEDYGIFGIVAPAGTPRVIVNRLNAETVKVIHLPDVKARQASEGVEVIGNTPEQFAALIKSDIAKWAEVVKRAGIRVD